MTKAARRVLGLSVQDVATQLGVHAETVKVWVRSGELSATRLGKGGKFWIATHDLEAFLAKRKT